MGEEDRELILEPEASAELEQATADYEEARPGLGREFLEAVEETLLFVKLLPAAGSLPPGVSSGTGAKKQNVRRFPYSVVYYDSGKSIRVVAIAHQRRRPGYWKRR